jgi:hypothetical protein
MVVVEPATIWCISKFKSTTSHSNEYYTTIVINTHDVVWGMEQEGGSHMLFILYSFAQINNMVYIISYGEQTPCTYSMYAVLFLLHIIIHLFFLST